MLRGGTALVRTAVMGGIGSPKCVRNDAAPPFHAPVEQGYFTYVGARGLLDAQRATFDQAQVNLAAAEDRRSVGVATIADVLQARTAVAQARLARLLGE